MNLERRTRAAFAALICASCTNAMDPETPKTDVTTRGGFALNDLSCRWPNNTIRYNFYDTWGDESPPQSTRDTFEDAVEYIEARTPLNFYEIFNTNGDYLMVYREPDEDDNSHAEVGFQGGETEVHLKDGISMIGVVHEIGHNLGMRHEHERPDRDDFVTVIWANIDSDDHDNFEMEDPSEHHMLTPYDHHSVMHYYSDSQCIEDLFGDCVETTSLTTEGIVTTDLTIKAKAGVDTAPDVPGLQTQFKVVDHMTKHDINALWLMYARELSDSEPDERLGDAMVIADFDMDGYDDVAISATKDIGDDGIPSGSVFVFKGTERTPIPWRLLHNGQLGTRGGDDEFGASLAVGDFNGDDFPDLAVGAPGARSEAGVTSGTVTLFRGGQFVGANRQPGLVDGSCTAKCSETMWPPLSPWLVLSRSSLGSVVEASTDGFGTAVGAGDGDGDGFDELIVGAPLASSRFGTGQATYYVGASIGSAALRGGLLSTHAIGPVRFRFGDSIATGDFDGNGRADVAIGAVGSDERVFVFCGRGRNVFEGAQLIESPEGLDGFGFSLTTGRLLENTMMGDALVIGAPQSLNAGGVRTGRVHVYGREGGSGSCEVFPYTVVDGVTVNERYGHAVLVTDVDGDGDRDLVVGAPKSGVGRVHVAASNGWTLTPAGNLNPPTGSGEFGTSLAAGEVKIDDEFFPTSSLMESPMRLFVGAPESDVAIFPMNNTAGAAYGFATDGTGTLMRKELYQHTDSPFSQ